MKITSEDLSQWRTGLHAANPEQAKALVAALDEMTTFRDNHHKLWCKEHEKTKALDQQVAVLREALTNIEHVGTVSGSPLAKLARAALSTTQPTGWVRVEDIERKEGK